MKSKGQQVTVDLSQAENIVCKSNGKIIPLYRVFSKRTITLMSPTGQGYCAAKLYSCGNCGEVYADGKDSES